MQCLTAQSGEKLDTFADLFRLERVAQAKAKAECRELHRGLFKINAVNALEEMTKFVDPGSSPAIAGSPMKH